MGGWVRVQFIRNSVHLNQFIFRLVDQAVRMMRLFSLLPLLQQSGILNSLTGGENS